MPFNVCTDMNISYVFPQNGQPMHGGQSPPEFIPPDVAQALDLLRGYSFRDVYRWLKIDRQDGNARPCINHASYH